MVRQNGWSHLAVLSDGDTWFRSNHVYSYFDKMTDDGFFDNFDNVLFYGAGPCGYAAAAFSVASPGARVLAIQPQATLDPRVTEWDDRFTEMRRLCFTDRYSYAPDMLDAASHGFVIYDPHEELDAMHAALFTRPNVTKLRMPHMGAALQTDLIEMGLLHELLQAMAEDRLNWKKFAGLFRARRDYAPYLRNLLIRTDGDQRDRLSLYLCRNVVERMNAPRFRRRLSTLEAQFS